MKTSVRTIATRLMSALGKEGIGAVNTFLTDLEKLAEIEKKMRLSIVLKNPMMGTAEKEKKLREWLTKAHISESAIKMAQKLVAMGRLKEIQKIIDALQDLREKNFSITRAEVVSAVALQKPQIEKISALVQKITGFQAVLLKPIIKPEVLGGLCITAGDRRLDATFSHQINNLFRHL